MDRDLTINANILDVKALFHKRDKVETKEKEVIRIKCTHDYLALSKEEWWKV